MPRELRKMMAAAPTSALAPSSPPRLTTADTKVIVLLAAWFILRKLQWILGPMRRRSGSWLVQYGAMAAYYLPTPLLFYAASTVYSSTSDMKAVLCIFCSYFLFLTALGPIVMTAYTLRLSDGPLQRWRLVPWLLYFLWLQFDFFGKGRKLTLTSLLYFSFVYVNPVLVALLTKSPVAKLDYETKAFADFMVLRKSSGSLFVVHGNNCLQNGCEYPIMSKHDGTWVTIKDLPSQHLDTFLSYSFCRLLARRYFKFPCVEEGDEEVRNLALTQLLSDHKRAFTLVEVQLAFLHDHFFTDYPTKMDTSGLQVLISVGMGCGISMSVTILLGYLTFGHKYISVRVLSMAVAGLVVHLLEVLPMFYPILLPNYWHPARQIFKYKGRVDSPASRCHSLGYYQSSKGFGQYSYWRNKIGQYSLLADYDHRSLKKACIYWFKQRLLSHASPGFIKHHPVAEDDVSVPNSVRRLVALTLKQHIKGPPTNGTRSLWMNRDLVPGGNLLWTCELECHTQIILLWHIATCYCEMLAEDKACDNHEVATTLSKYCAYLVAFLPEFLPEHRLTSVIELQNILQTAKDMLGPTRRMSMEDKLSKIQGLELPEGCANLTDHTFQKGIYLGRQLMKQDHALVRWKVMAEFWAETILYVAPSDDAAAHVEHLAKGGEFVTHLWAMLSNAGILQRAAEETTPSQHQHVVLVPSSGATGEDPGPRLRRSYLSLPTRFGH